MITKSSISRWILLLIAVINPKLKTARKTKQASAHQAEGAQRTFDQIARVVLPGDDGTSSEFG